MIDEVYYLNKYKGVLTLNKQNKIAKLINRSKHYNCLKSRHEIVVYMTYAIHEIKFDILTYARSGDSRNEHAQNITYGIGLITGIEIYTPEYVPNICENKTICIIDDVYHRGHTLNKMARTYKQAGAKKVIGYVFCKGK